MEQSHFIRAKHVTQPVKCRVCNNRIMLSRLVTLNKLVRPCKCRPICELCLVQEIKDSQAEIVDVENLRRFTCAKCSTHIYYLPDFKDQFISLKEMSPSERCIFYILLLQCVLVLSFGTLTLGLSVRKSEEWVGIVIFILCVLLQIMLIPNVLVRFTHRFYTKKRRNRRPSTVNAYLFASGKYLQDIMDDSQGKPDCPS